jgi:hypothetical protein
MHSVTVGEVHTGLLHNSSAVSTSVAERLVDVVLGERVIRSERPISHVISPPVLTGVDCHLPASQGPRPHAVGTVTSRASITGGHILQGVSYTTVHLGPSDHRLPWSYYLARPGQLHTVNQVRLEPLATDFLEQPLNPGQLDVHAIARRTVDAIQDRPGLDRRTAVRSARTYLRFAIPCGTKESPGRPVVTFGLHGESGRTLQLAGTDAAVAAQIEFCADVARHDWLLTTLRSVMERSRVGVGARADLIDRLKPALDHLLHLWMPAARTEAALHELWQAIEGRPGFSRQWQATVDRIRDQIALSLLERLGKDA